MQEFYKILNLTENASDEEIELAYKELKAKYSKERFLEGEEGNHAAKMLTKVETAYYEIKEARRHVDKQTEKPNYSEVESLLKNGNVSGAQMKLDEYTDRDAEWHYLQSVIFYKKNWANESKKQLEIAMNMDPHNEKYSTAYEKLKDKMAFNEKQFKSGNSDTQTHQNMNDRQMGATDNGCCSYCASLCCMNLLCNACCRF